jgi:hypothetical protein
LNDKKIQLHEVLKEIQQKLGRNDVALDSFILSVASYNELIRGVPKPPSKDEYIEKHVHSLMTTTGLKSCLIA